MCSRHIVCNPAYKLMNLVRDLLTNLLLDLTYGQAWHADKTRHRLLLISSSACIHAGQSHWQHDGLCGTIPLMLAVQRLDVLASFVAYQGAYWKRIP